MTVLDVPGAKLYYEAYGEGTTVLCISGGNGNASPWTEFAHQLQDRYRVIIYDRRGFSRSVLTDTQDYEHRIETDTDDCAALIKQVGNGEPAIVIGSSSGAIVTFELVCRYPDLIKVAFPHEPPAIRFAPDHEDLWAKQQEIYQIYRQGGAVPAMKEFMKQTKFESRVGDMGALLNPQMNPFAFSNIQYWFEREFLTYPLRQFDEEKLKNLREKFILINGDESVKTAMQYRINTYIAELLGTEVLDLPGDHFGYASHAEQFAKKFVQALEK